MRHFIILFYFISFAMQCTHTHPYIVGYYEHEVDKKLITDDRFGTISLSLYPNNIYYLDLIEDPDCNSVFNYISHGTWKIGKNKLVLTDHDNNFKTICTYKHIEDEPIEITVEKSFKWLTGLTFIYTKVDFFDIDNICPDLNDLPPTDYFNRSLAKKERIKQYFSKNKNTLLFGEYNWGFDILLIQPDNSYKLLFNHYSIGGYDKEILFSEGKWKRRGNVLTLYDKSVKCPFYLIITEEGLKPIQMMYNYRYFPDPFEYDMPPFSDKFIERIEKARLEEMKKSDF